jgi:hypothetical protein
MKVHICNNDKNGNWTDSFSTIEFDSNDDTAIRLETKTMHPVKAEVFDVSMWVQQLRIYGVTVKCSLSGTWTGNMMWNTLDMLDYYALGLLRALQFSNEWQVVDGWSELCRKFDEKEEITGFDFELPEDIEPRVINPNQLELFKQ